MKNLCLLSILVFMLSGCSYFSSDQNNSESAPVSQSSQLCKELKRNLIFNRTSTSIMEAASATQRAQMMRLYEKYNCGKLEK